MPAGVVNQLPDPPTPHPLTQPPTHPKGSDNCRGGSRITTAAAAAVAAAAELSHAEMKE